MTDDVLRNKAQVIARCLKRVYQGEQENLKNITKQDAIVLNIQRAVEAAIDMAMHVVAEKRLGLPQTSREAFVLLRDQGVLDDELASRLLRMVGFRNVAVHAYQELRLDTCEASSRSA